MANGTVWGSFTGAKTSAIRPTLVWSSTTDTATNTSSVSASLVFRKYNSGYTSYNLDAPAFSITIDGDTRTVNADFDMRSNSSYTVMTHTRTITHNADGKKKISVSASGNTYVSLQSISLSGEIILDTIPRASTPTLSSGAVNFGSAVTIHTNRASSSFSHTIKYSGIGSGTIVSRTTSSSYNWTVPNDLMNQIPNSTYVNITISLETYSGNTLIGTKTVGLRLNVPASVSPSRGTVSLTDTNGLVRMQIGQPVATLSAMRLTVEGASGVYGSTIKNYTFRYSTDHYQYIPTAYKSVTTTSNFFTIPALETDLIAWDITITDSRGRTNYHSSAEAQAIELVPYWIPEISDFKVERVNTSGNPDGKGDRVKVTASTSIHPLFTKNLMVIQVRYKRVGSTGSPTTINWDMPQWLMEDREMIITGISASYSYEFELYLADAFNINTRTVTISSGSTTMSFYPGGKGVAFGQIATRPGFEIAPDWPIYMPQSIVSPTIIPEGGNLNNFEARGLYVVTSNDIGNSLINGASSEAGYYMVFRLFPTSRETTQIYIPYRTSRPFRMRWKTFSGVWSAWESIGGGGN